MTRVPGAVLEMTSLAAEIPGYLQGRNPGSIAAVTRRLCQILKLPLDRAPLRTENEPAQSKRIGPRPFDPPAAPSGSGGGAP